MTPALQVTDLSHDYGGKQALSDVSFSIEAGQFYALLGPNGAGKSTLFSLLTRLQRAKSGQIHINGHEVTRSSASILGQIGVVFQKPTLDLDMTVDRNMRYFAGLHGLGGQQARDKIETALRQLSLWERRWEKVRVLNGGHRRRVEIARALICEPTLLLLDEPTAGLDAQSRQSVIEHVHALVNGGVSVLWATHLVDEIMPDDHVIVLHGGKVIANDRASTLSAQRPLLDVFLEMTQSVQAPVA